VIFVFKTISDALFRPLAWPLNMPLVVLCGQPSSGKSGVAAVVAGKFRAAGIEVVVVAEDGLHLERNSSYAGGGWPF
jgi:hypothetical protein